MEREGIVLNIEESTETSPDRCMVVAGVEFVDNLEKDIMDLIQYGCSNALNQEHQEQIRIAKEKSVAAAETEGDRRISEIVTAILDSGYPKDKLKVSYFRTKPKTKGFYESKNSKVIDICVGHSYTADITMVFEGVDEDTVLLKKIHDILVSSHDVTDISACYMLSREKEERVKESLLPKAIDYANKKAANIATVMNEHYHVEKPVYFNMLSRSHDVGRKNYLEPVGDNIFNPAFIGKRNVNIVFEIGYQILDKS